jgi:hypothetical protein
MAASFMVRDAAKTPLLAMRSSFSPVGALWMSAMLP